MSSLPILTTGCWHHRPARKPAEARMRLLGRWLFGLMTLAITASSAVAQDSPADECDRLAAEPGVVAGFAGVTLDSIDAEPAMAACAAAVEQSPGNPRYSHQYGRALERAGRLQDARRLYEWAAGDGYAPAEAALQRLDAIQSAGDSEPSTEERAHAAQNFAALSAALRRYANTLPPDPADPLNLVAEVGADPDALFDWVAQHTRLVAYRGSLRDARGVLLDRAGNSLDRALLLVTLMRLTGQEARLAHATLSVDQARALLPASRREITPPPLRAESEDEMVALFVTAGVDSAMARQAAAEAAIQEKQVRALIQERFSAVFPVVRGHVSSAVADGNAAAEKVALAALQDHWWIQLRTGQGWRDLDPDGAALGAVTPSETIDARSAPDAMRHAVTLRIVLELQDADGRREEKLLEWGGYTNELIDRPILFSHMPHGLATVEQLIATTDYRDRMMEALDRETAWVPILLVGAEAHTDKLFTRDGAVRTPDINAFVGSGGAIASLATQVSALFGEEQTAGPKPAVPTAEWLEIEVRAPGEPPVIERRTVFDLVGPAAREAGTSIVPTPEQLRLRALELLSETKILITGATPADAHVARVAARDLAAIADALAAVVMEPADTVLDNLPQVPELPLGLYAFAGERLRDRPAALSGANVVLQHRRFSIDAGGNIQETAEIDIVYNTVRPAHDPFMARVEQGVMDTVVESVVLAGLPSSANAAAFHAEDIAAGRSWTRIASAGGAELASAAVPPDFRARVARDLDAGLIVLAPADIGAAAAEGRLAWWRIDPRTGTTLGMLPGGGGATLGEWAHKIYHIMHKAACAYSALGVAVGHTENAMTGLGFALCVAGGVAPGGVGKVIGVVGMAVHILEWIQEGTGQGPGGK
jgi:hypothetical protein